MKTQGEKHKLIMYQPFGSKLRMRPFTNGTIWGPHLFYIRHFRAKLLWAEPMRVICGALFLGGVCLVRFCCWLQPHTFSLPKSFQPSFNSFNVQKHGLKSTVFSYSLLVKLHNSTRSACRMCTEIFLLSLEGHFIPNKGTVILLLLRRTLSKKHMAAGNANRLR